jgi:hypothetical protein
MTLVSRTFGIVGGTALAIAALTMPSVGTAEISSPFGNAGTKAFGGFNINTPVGNAGVNTPFGGFNINTPVGNAGVNTPFGGFNLGPVGVNTPFGGFNINTPVGNAGVNTPFGGFNLGPVGVNTPFGGFNLYGAQLQAMHQAMQMQQGANAAQQSGVTCAFGKETLMAASVNSCENAGGRVNPAQVSYTVQCNLGGNVVMTPTKAACSRVNGQVAQ